MSHAGQTGPGFDGEGVARQGLTLVENGVVREVAMSRGTAARIREIRAGGKTARCARHRARLRSAERGWRVGGKHRIQGGAGEAKTVEEMIAATGRGLLVTRLWYIREVDAYEKILTGMTRDGTFVVENGRVGSGIRNFRFNQSVIQMLRQVLDLGRSGAGVRRGGF